MDTNTFPVALRHANNVVYDANKLGPESYQEGMSWDYGAPPELQTPVDVVSAFLRKNSRPPDKAKAERRLGWMTKLASNISVIFFILATEARTFNITPGRSGTQNSRNVYSEISTGWRKNCSVTAAGAVTTRGRRLRTVNGRR